MGRGQGEQAGAVVQAQDLPHRRDDRVARRRGLQVLKLLQVREVLWERGEGAAHRLAVQITSGQPGFDFGGAVKEGICWCSLGCRRP